MSPLYWLLTTVYPLDTSPHLHPLPLPPRRRHRQLPKRSSLAPPPQRIPSLPPLALPHLPAPPSLVRQHPGPGLAKTPRPLPLLPHPHLRPIPHRRIHHRRTLRPLLHPLFHLPPRPLLDGNHPRLGRRPARPLSLRHHHPGTLATILPRRLHPQRTPRRRAHRRQALLHPPIHPHAHGHHRPPLPHHPRPPPPTRHPHPR